MIAKTIRTCFPIAAAAVSDKAEEINKLNVFPVPDGDTGPRSSPPFLPTPTWKPSPPPSLTAP